MATISKAEILSIKEYGNDIREYILKLDTPAYFDAGSFLQLTLEQKIGNRWPESRNFSIASAYKKTNTIKLIIRRVGYYTSRIFEELGVGKTCYVKLAFGDFLLPFKNRNSAIVCIAGGTGIAPILSFIEELSTIGEGHRVKLLYSVKNSNEFIGKEVIASVKEENIFISVTREKVDGFASRHITLDDVKKLAVDFKKDNFYICGGEVFTKQFKNELLAKGATNIFTDEW
jgi:NAD(P)H-flavin reductase